MAKAKLKTSENSASVEDFIDSISDEQKRKDSQKLLEIMKRATGEKPKMWGKSIVGFGKYEYKYYTGREGEFCKAAFSPRKATLTVYLMDGTENHKADIKKLGKTETAVSCLYIKKLEDIDLDLLEKIIKKSYENMPDVLKTEKPKK